MAFELPDHLPRGGLAQDRPTQVLTKIGQATKKTLNASLAASWLAELDSNVQDTKSRISRRTHEDLPALERQLNSFASIQTRLTDLSVKVGGLEDSLNNPETGVIPMLLQTLTVHKSLFEQAHYFDITHRALEHLLRMRVELYELSDRLEEGELQESAQASMRVQTHITKTPKPLDSANIMNDIKKRHRMLYDRLQEQLGDAYARSVVFSSSVDTITLTILFSTRVTPTSARITLPAILQSLSQESLSARLSVFRRDLLGKFVNAILQSPGSVIASTSDSSPTLCLSLSPPASAPLNSLRTLVTFLESHFFPHLPSAEILFPTTFYSPVATAALSYLLKPSVPSSVIALPSFLGILDDAVHFEDSILPTGVQDRPIRHWANDVASHYEKNRREFFLQKARTVVNEPEDGVTFRVEVAVKQPLKSPSKSATDRAGADAQGWDCDDSTLQETFVSQTAQSQNGTHDNAHALTSQVQNHEETSRDGDDNSDGWGWGDDSEGGIDEADSLQNVMPEVEALSSVRDDPWDDDGWTDDPMPSSPQILAQEPQPRISFPLPNPTPKMATRLEKFSAKAKGASTANAPVAHPVVSNITQPQPRSPRPGLPLLPQEQCQEKEAYLVSERARKVLKLAEEVMREGQELLQSNVFAKHPSGKLTIPGQLLVAAAPSILDLHRALYPIAHSSLLSDDLNLAMWSNDCRFLCDRITGLKHCYGSTSAVDRWLETEDKLRTLGELCFGDVVLQQQESVQNLLVDAEGFIDVSNGERFERCKSIVERVLEKITLVAHQWKETLTQSRYLHATGLVVDDALFRVMDDVLSLENIPEIDSERLSELCELLAPLEELFVIVPGEQSTVGSHVPLWFKFSYLSWLIKGSIADLGYLFDQGMLVDYGIDELVRLLRALFAETPLRENTIAKIIKGHPLSLREK